MIDLKNFNKKMLNAGFQLYPESDFNIVFSSGVECYVQVDSECESLYISVNDGDMDISPFFRTVTGIEIDDKTKEIKVYQSSVNIDTFDYSLSQEVTGHDVSKRLAMKEEAENLASVAIQFGADIAEMMKLKYKKRS